jgi:hypothetical protein
MELVSFSTVVNIEIINTPRNFMHYCFFVHFLIKNMLGNESPLAHHSSLARHPPPSIRKRRRTEQNSLKPVRKAALCDPALDCCRIDLPGDQTVAQVGSIGASRRTASRLPRHTRQAQALTVEQAEQTVNGH